MKPYRFILAKIKYQIQCLEYIYLWMRNILRALQVCVSFILYYLFNIFIVIPYRNYANLRLNVTATLYVVTFIIYIYTNMPSRLMNEYRWRSSYTNGMPTFLSLRHNVFGRFMFELYEIRDASVFKRFYLIFDIKRLPDRLTGHLYYVRRWSIEVYIRNLQ